MLNNSVKELDPWSRQWSCTPPLVDGLRATTHCCLGVSMRSLYGLLGCRGLKIRHGCGCMGLTGQWGEILEILDVESVFDRNLLR